MGLKIGKFIGRIASGVVKNAPAIAAGFAGGGPGGAALAVLGSATYGSRAASNTPTGTPAMFNQPSSRFPSSSAGNMGNYPMVQVKNQQLGKTMDQEIFNGAMILLGKLNIVPRDPNKVAFALRSALGKIIRFVQKVPGSSLVAMLVTMGLTDYLATKIVTWYTVSGKKRRRIRVTNVKALRRSVRRLEGFHKLARKVDMALTHRGVGRARARRPGPCRTCRKNPCSC